MSVKCVNSIIHLLSKETVLGNLFQIYALIKKKKKLRKKLLYKQNIYFGTFNPKRSDELVLLTRISS